MAYDYKRFITVTPLLLRAGAGKKEITFHARLGHARKLFDETPQVRVFQVEGPVQGYRQWLRNTPDAPLRREENGDIVVTMEAPVEGEYTLCFGAGNENGDFTVQTAFSVYALRDDLFELMPYRGDFHMHSNCSDGKENPEYVAATCRRNGCDFMALTDHRRYAPSLVAKAAMEEFDTDMLTLPGEEVHLPDNPTHIVNFGGNASVNDLANSDEAAYRAAVAEYMKSVPEKYDPATRFQVAASEWTFDRIREHGGVAMFCHPFWRPAHHNYIGSDVIDLLLERRRFDVLEVIGGFLADNTEFNMLVVSRWQQELAKGNILPVAGVSDCHTCDGVLSGWYYTIVFAKELSFPAIAEAIRANRSVAVHAIPDTFPIVVGPYRLTQVAYFLLREFYPRHNELCRVEGEIMRRALGGDEPEAKQLLAERKGTVEKFMRSCREATR